MFGRKAAEVTAAIKALRPAASFALNAERPRKGTFEVRVGGVAVLSLVGLPRPFTKLREADLAAVARDAAARLAGGGAGAAPAAKAKAAASSSASSSAAAAAPPAAKKARK